MTKPFAFAELAARIQTLARRPSTAAGGLIVDNTGPLVPPNRVGGQFEPFRRLSGDRLDHGGGVGPGLTIARTVVTAHDGTITARANSDGGSTVTVQLTPMA